jgi:ubiquinone/menaquinone biosynthesis C-methylase UbiE
VNAVNILSDFTEGLDEINLADGKKNPSGSHAKSIKDAIATFYDMAALGFEKDHLWNWGMCDEDVARQINELIPNFDKFDTDGFSEQLYFRALRQVPVDLDDYADKSVLEVSCGVGIGLDFLARVVDARSMVGLDLSAKAIEYANARLSRRSNLRYVEGDAEKIPFDDNSFDVVVNVESAHNYPDLGKFLDEAARVLKPGGYLTLLDFFTEQRHQQLTLLEQAHSGLEWIHESDVSAQVKAGIARRLAPGSHFRTAFDEKKMSSLEHRIGEHFRAIMFGGLFAGYQEDAFIKVLRRTGALPYALSLGQHSTRSSRINPLAWAGISKKMIKSGRTLRSSGKAMSSRQTWHVGSYRHYVAKKV